MKSPELQTAIDVGWRMGDAMRHYFNSTELAEGFKDDDTIVTEADLAISDWVVAFYRQYGRGVVSEERGRSAEYGAFDAEYLDPIDGTRNFSEARKFGHQSIAAFSQGCVSNGRIVRGVVNFPLMHYPRLYWAEETLGAYRVMTENGPEVPLEVDQRPTRGVVLVSENYSRFDEPLERCGLTAVHLGPTVFRACAVADEHLVNDFDPRIVPLGEKVIGFISSRTSAHGYVGAAAVVRAAGGIACGTDGGELLLTAGKNGCIFANNETTRDMLIETVNAA